MSLCTPQDLDPNCARQAHEEDASKQDAQQQWGPARLAEQIDARQVEEGGGAPDPTGGAEPTAGDDDGLDRALEEECASSADESVDTA